MGSGSERWVLQEAPAGLGSPLRHWDFVVHFYGVVGGGSVCTERDESLRSLMKGHSILRVSERHLFLQQNSLIAKVPLAPLANNRPDELSYLPRISTRLGKE